MIKYLFKLNLIILMFLISMNLYAKNHFTQDQYDYFLLGRLGYGANEIQMEHIQAIGDERWIKEQLKFHGDEGLPLGVKNSISQMSISKPQIQFINDNQIYALMKNTINYKDLSDDDKKNLKEKEQHIARVVSYEGFKRNLLRSVYSPYGLQEKMDWFWMNHFSAFSQKGIDRFLIADYEESLRPYALGHFRDLLLISLMHPVMQEYLDNIQNTGVNSLVNQKQLRQGINENYAREFLELHTLGVNGGYTQKDVQELARIFTGLGIIKVGDNIQMKPEVAQYARTQEGTIFFFDPRRHDFGDKVFLGHTIHGTGFDEILQVIDIVSNNPATAKHISTQLANYFVSDNPSQELITKMSHTFLDTHGNISDVLNTMIHSTEFKNQVLLSSKFKMPHEYLISSLKLLNYNDALFINNVRNLYNIENNLGERLYGKETPDGYNIKNQEWENSDQISQRIEFSNNLVHSNNHFFITDNFYNDQKEPNNIPKELGGFNIDSIKVVGYFMGDKNKNLINQTQDLNQQLSLILASPEFMMH